MQKSFAHKKDLLRHRSTIHGEKSFKCHLCPYKSARMDTLVSHQRTHTKTSFDQVFNGNLKASEAETYLSRNKMNLPQETEPKELCNLTRKNSHQEKVSSLKHPQQKILLENFSLQNEVCKSSITLLYNIRT